MVKREVRWLTLWGVSAEPGFKGGGYGGFQCEGRAGSIDFFCCVFVES